MKNGNIANIVIALGIGAVVGFVVGKSVGGNGSSAGGNTALVAGRNPDSGKTVANLPADYIKEAALTGIDMSALNPGQKYAVMKAINEVNCDCGCGMGSLAVCKTKDPNCPKSPAQIAKAIDLVKQGKNSEEIKTALGGGGAAKPSAAAGDDSNSVYKVDLGDAYIQGNKNAKITIVEFSDFQCPFCGRVEPTLEQIKKTYGSDVRIAWKNQPLPFHPFAQPTAQAALAAGAQGKFWEMHDKLFDANQHSGSLEAPAVEKMAQDIGLDMAKFKADLSAKAYQASIDRDVAQANKLRASGTPHFFVNGRRIRGAVPFEQFKTVIDEELKKADAALSRGVAKDELYAELTKNGLTEPPAAPAAPAPSAPAATFHKITDLEGPTRGSKDAKVTIVMWSDYQCPFCGRVEPTLKQVMDTYKSDVRIVWKNQPLSFHPNAMPAAEAATAVYKEGGNDKFWAMHDKLFENQRDLSPENYKKWAGEVGVNMGKWQAAVDGHKFKDDIQKDMTLGNSVGANGTPAFYIDGREVSGAQPFESFKAVIDDELKKADALLKKGVKKPELYAKLLDENAKAQPSAPTAVAAPPDNGAPVKIDAGSSPAKGPKNAPITIVEFSDFQCPFCSRAEPTITRIMDEYKGKVRVVWKNQPLPFHPNAMPAAEAAMAAGEQGAEKFWEMHDKLFADQQALGPDKYAQYAKEIGLDMGKWKAALDAHKDKAAIDDDMKIGTSVGAQGTPTFFINGKKLVGAQPFEQFKTVIDAELARK